MMNCNGARFYQPNLILPCCYSCLCSCDPDRTQQEIVWVSLPAAPMSQLLSRIFLHPIISLPHVWLHHMIQQTLWNSTMSRVYVAYRPSLPTYRSPHLATYVSGQDSNNNS